MRYGLYMPNFGAEVSALSLAELAAEAERAGWDGMFLWDHMLYSQTQKLNLVDPWIALTAMAMKTTRLRFGTSVTPLARRRPWHLARETTTLDQLAGGRLILSVGLGDLSGPDFASFGEETDPRRCGEMLDEGLEILAGLWSGRPFAYQGKHYRLKKMAFRPVSPQKPHIPVWVGGFWPNKAPFRRAARWDGIIPLKKSGGFFLTPEDLGQVLDFIRPLRADATPLARGADATPLARDAGATPFDAAIIGTRPGLGKKPAAVKKSLAQLEQAGATWWLQALFLERNSFDKQRAAILQGPPQG
jgi:alkanesulfonate monooxygenase SsuD/methylene tetrahydromethanopterin reductase-like flavin-dependent oxidoreductase (luciferase family)